MIIEMPVPSPGESISEVEIAQWFVKDGDYVEKDQTIAEVDSDKATLDLPAKESGTITLKAQEGDTVLVGDTVCLIDTSGKKVMKKTNDIKPPPVNKNEKPKVVENKSEKTVSNSHSGVPSPAARKILDDKGVNYENVKGTRKRW
jgi:Pyruvate/2-oxoglutarate dehydrogenase complex, dihydrolipoamide acyltransferase (E2) component, and related enzymes